MPDPTAQVILTPADFADTGQWRLLIYVSSGGMRALLRHASDKSRPAVQIFNEEWRSESPDILMRHIENAVYEHPSVLDDYATEIVVEAQELTWVPSGIFDGDGISEDVAEEIFRSVYPEGSCEVMADRIGEETALYTLAPGFDGFMARTIPGARMRSHLGVLAERLRRMDAGSGRLRVYADIRERRMDLLAFRGEGLVSASLQSWNTPEDAAFRIFSLLNAYSSGAEDSEVYLRGDGDNVREVLSLTSGFCHVAGRIPLPEGVDALSLPLAAALSLYK